MKKINYAKFLLEERLKTRHYITAFCAIVLLFFFSLSYGQIKVAERINAKELSGKYVRLLEKKGDATFIFFMKENCKYCKKALDEIYDLEKEFKNVKFIAIFMTNDSVENAKVYIKKHYQKRFSNILIASKKIRETYKFKGTPAVFFINSNLKVVDQVDGFLINYKKIIKKKLKKLN